MLAFYTTGEFASCEVTKDGKGHDSRRVLMISFDIKMSWNWWHMKHRRKYEIDLSYNDVNAEKIMSH